MGGDLATGVLLAAQAAAKLASVVKTVNEATRGAVGIFLGFSAGATLMTLGVVEAVTGIRRSRSGGQRRPQGVDQTPRMAEKERAGALLLSPAFLGITGALAVLAVGTAFIIQRYRRHRKSVEDVREAYKNLDKTMANFSKRRLNREEQKRLEGVPPNSNR